MYSIYTYSACMERNNIVCVGSIIISTEYVNHTPYIIAN